MDETTSSIADDEPRYTLDEARVELARGECAVHGHDFEIVQAFGNNAPVKIFCDRCGRSWPVGVCA